MPDLGLEGLLGTSGGELAQDLRDRLALSTRYLANWYRATDGSENKAVWWQKIDTVRSKVERAYADLLEASNASFAGVRARGDYDDASASWAQLWRELSLSADTIDFSLIDQIADWTDTIAHAPGLLVPQIGNEIGKAVGGALGGFLAQTWPYLAGAGLLYVAYVFRRPLVALAGKVGA